MEGPLLTGLAGVPRDRRPARRRPRTRRRTATSTARRCIARSDLGRNWERAGGHQACPEESASSSTPPGTSSRAKTRSCGSVATPACCFGRHDGGIDLGSEPRPPRASDAREVAARRRWHVLPLDPSRGRHDVHRDLGGGCVPQRRRRRDAGRRSTRTSRPTFTRDSTRRSGSACTSCSCIRRDRTGCGSRTTAASTARTTAGQLGAARRKRAAVGLRFRAGAATPTDPDVAYVIPESRWRATFHPDGRLGVYRTGDGGASWQLTAERAPQNAPGSAVLREGIRATTTAGCTSARRAAPYWTAPPAAATVDRGGARPAADPLGRSRTV